jgi:hypothetical protein
LESSGRGFLINENEKSNNIKHPHSCRCGEDFSSTGKAMSMLQKLLSPCGEPAGAFFLTENKN